MSLRFQGLSTRCYLSYTLHVIAITAAAALVSLTLGRAVQAKSIIRNYLCAPGAKIITVDRTVNEIKFKIANCVCGASAESIKVVARNYALSRLRGRRLEGPGPPHRMNMKFGNKDEINIRLFCYRWETIQKFYRPRQ